MYGSCAESKLHLRTSWDRKGIKDTGYGLIQPVQFIFKKVPNVFGSNDKRF